MHSFTSFAQNFEDVILWRALQHVQNGFYVDCGAFDPTNHSVTKAFYDRGWCGINIEPVPHLSAAFDDERPNDINLNIALSDRSDISIFYEIVDTGLSTFNPTIARQHIEEGFVAKSIDVRTDCLSNVLADYPEKEIHFLKIDVEGSELAVLTGLNLSSHRPWIVLVEAVHPRTHKLNHLEWESLLLSEGYDFAYFDGLNRFYVAHEHYDLCERLAVPPNVFDNFVRADALADLKAAQLELAALKFSTSWRLTAPIRKVRTSLRVLKNSFPGSAVRMVRTILQRRTASLSWTSQLFQNHAEQSSSLSNRALFPET